MTSKPGLILLVEDNADDVELTQVAFEQSHIVNEVVVARDGVEALDFLFATGAYAGRDTSVMPQLVLLDLKLPRIDGLGVLRRIRADDRTRRLPVVMLTTSNQDSDIIACYDLGANSYIRKPVDFAQFSENALHLGVYWLGLNQLPSQDAARP